MLGSEKAPYITSTQVDSSNKVLTIMGTGFSVKGVSVSLNDKAIPVISHTEARIMADIAGITPPLSPGTYRLAVLNAAADAGTKREDLSSKNDHPHSQNSATFAVVIGGITSQGPAGPTGPQGSVGLPGVAGPTGPQGQQGPAGPITNLLPVSPGMIGGSGATTTISDTDQSTVFVVDTPVGANQIIVIPHCDVPGKSLIFVPNMMAGSITFKSQPGESLYEDNTTRYSEFSGGGNPTWIICGGTGHWHLMHNL